MRKYSYMIVTNDEYELPMCIGTCEMIAKKLGISKSNVINAAKGYEEGKVPCRKEGKVVRVKM